MSVTTNKWLKFFSDAGLPLTVATEYAIIFTSHRIQNDMLTDLTKEILYDMGIKTMGDVIAILRHAKSVTHDTTRDQLLGPTSDPKEESRALQTKSVSSNQSCRPLSSRFKTISAPDSTQNCLKRSAQTSGLTKSTNPKIRRIVANDEEEEEDFDDNHLETNVGEHEMSADESLLRSTKTSVFSRLGAERSPEKTVFSRLGNNSGLDSKNPKRRVTISRDSINSSLEKRNIIRLNSNNNSNNRTNSLFISKTVTNNRPKKPILAPTSLMRSSQTETVSVKDRIGTVRKSNSNIVSTTNRLIVKRNASPNLAMNRTNTPSPAVAMAKRIAMRRAVDSNQKRTISLRKNIFDRLGPISL